MSLTSCIIINLNTLPLLFQDDLEHPERRHSIPSTLQQTKDDNFILRTNHETPHHMNNVSSYHGLDSPHVSARLSEHLPDAYRQAGPIYSQTSHHIQAGFHSSPALPVSGDFDSDKQLPHPPTQTSAFFSSLPPVLGHLHFPSVAPHMISSAKEEEEHSVLNVEDVLHTLSSALEDYHGQYTELQRLEDLVKVAQKLIRVSFALLQQHFPFLSNPLWGPTHVILGRISRPERLISTKLCV